MNNTDSLRLVICIHETHTQTPFHSFHNYYYKTYCLTPQTKAKPSVPVEKPVPEPPPKKQAAQGTVWVIRIKMCICHSFIKAT